MTEKLPEQAQPKLSEKTQGTTPVEPEQLVLRERFTLSEKEVLRNDGAVIYELSGTTISNQKEAQKVKGKPSFWYLVNYESLLTRPSRKMEVAIYAEPARFFVPDSFSRSVKRQEELVAKDAGALRQRLNLTDISEIIPDTAATLTEITFQHLDATDVWLFSKEYAAALGLDWVYGRTKNPTTPSGSNVCPGWLCQP